MAQTNTGCTPCNEVASSCVFVDPPRFPRNDFFIPFSLSFCHSSGANRCLHDISLKDRSSVALRQILSIDEIGVHPRWRLDVGHQLAVQHCLGNLSSAIVESGTQAANNQDNDVR